MYTISFRRPSFWDGKIVKHFASSAAHRLEYTYLNMNFDNYFFTLPRWINAKTIGV